MRKLAIFVEGLTEQILVRKMLQAVLDRNRVAIQTVKITGGQSVKMSFTVMRAAHVDNRTEYYVLVYDCGGETNVKSYMMARRNKLISNGYSMILGLRDVYPNFERTDVPKLQKGLNYRLPQKGAFTRIFLAVMETEAWFLGEYRHLKKISKQPRRPGILPLKPFWQSTRIAGRTAAPRHYAARSRRSELRR